MRPSWMWVTDKRVKGGGCTSWNKATEDHFQDQEVARKCLLCNDQWTGGTRRLVGFHMA